MVGTIKVGSLNVLAFFGYYVEGKNREAMLKTNFFP